MTSLLAAGTVRAEGVVGVGYMLSGNGAVLQE